MGKGRFDCIQKAALSHACTRGRDLKQQGSGSVKVNRGKVIEYVGVFLFCFLRPLVFVFVHVWPCLCYHRTLARLYINNPANA